MTRLELADRAWSIARPLAWLLVAAALVAPAVAMRFTAEVRWTPLDFIAASTLLVGGGLLCETFAWCVRNGVARILFALTIVALVVLCWGAAIN